LEAFLVSSSVNAIIAQRLLRKICKKCMEPFTPSREYLAQVGVTEEELGGRPLYRSTGCQDCLNTGYQGRIGIFEMMVMNEDLKSYILMTSDSNQIRKRAIETGNMITLRQDGLKKVMAGLTTMEEVFRVT